MALDELSLEITANSNDAEKSIDSLCKSLERLKKNLNLSSSSQNYANAMKNITNSANGMSKAMSSANISMKNIASGSTNNGFKNLFNTISTGSNRASGGMKSLAYYFGKFYANFWILRRGLGLLKSSVDYASDLVEVQNVVDNTFGSEANKVEDLANNAIQFFGMSRLTTKQISSEFQAMGNAMGITNQMVKESNKTWSAQNEELQKTGQGYNNTAESMADMSVNLTKLASDMGSFYNQDYNQVGERLASGIFTGQTRVLSFSTYAQRCA